MAIVSFPFDSQTTTETQYSKFFRQIIGTGVVGTPGDVSLQATAPATGMLVNVATGAAVVRGHYVESDAVAPLMLANGATSVRIDVIALRLNPATNNISLVVVAGTPGGGAPALTQTDTGIYELALAQVTVPANATAIGNPNITDLRTYSGQGLVLNHKLANMAQATVKGRAAGAGTGPPTDLTSAELKAMIAFTASDIVGFAEAAQDATLAALADSSEIDWTYNDAGNAASGSLVAGSVADSKLASMPQGTIKGRASGAGTGAPSALTASQVLELSGAAPLVENVSAISSITGAHTVPAITAATIVRRMLIGNATLTFPTAAAGARFLLELKQDTTGARTVTWPVSVKWPGGAAPTLSVAASRSDFFAFTCTDGATWVGAVAGQNYLL